MATNDGQPEDRWQTIRQIWRDSRFEYQLMGGAVLVGLGVLIGAALFAGDTGYPTNLYTELLSIGVTVFVLDLLARRREERREEAHLKADLIMRLGSQVNDTAVSAANELSKRGWLYDGSLQGADLSWAGLQRADLFNADLRGVKLYCADLQESILGQADLRGADLDSANLQKASVDAVNLQEANLYGANLQGAHLGSSKLQRAFLWGADLQNAFLRGTDLQGAYLLFAQLEGAIFDESTTLPDGTNWTPDTDLSRFTDLKHPVHLQPEWVKERIARKD